MRVSIIIFIVCLGFNGCVSKAKYNSLKLQKEKMASKTEKLDSKLKALNHYQQQLQDSLENSL